MAAAKTWFVQTGFGAVLGPMPEDALREMVRTGALLRSDQVREGAEGEWHPTSEMPGLFDAATSANSPMKSEAIAIAEVAMIAPVTTAPSSFECAGRRSSTAGC